MHICVIKMAIISIRIDDKLKKEMDRLKHINWNEIIRRAIIRTINEEKVEILQEQFC